MKHESQALHLAKMMQKHAPFRVYDLTLPLVIVRSNKLKKLSLNDTLLTGCDRLEPLLMDETKICAKIRLKPIQNRYEAEIVHETEEPIEQIDSKKYKILKISFGTVKSKALNIGSAIDISQLDLKKVTLVSEGIAVAEGTLVNVDDEIAIQIKKVN